MLLESVVIAAAVLAPSLDEYCLAFLKGQSIEITKAANADELAYQGAFLCMQAEDVISPFSKYSYFKEGTDLIEQAIEQSPNSFHARLARYLIQYNSPSFLMYNDELDEDAAFLKSYFLRNKQNFPDALQKELNRVLSETKVL